MDIRLRLLLAFTPLLILLVGTAIALPFVQRETRLLLAQQVAAADALADVQNLELSILHEHDAVIHIVEGQDDDSSARFAEARRQATELIARRESEGRQILPQNAEIPSLYLALSRRHDIAVATFEAGDQVAAEDQMHEPSTDALLDRILALSAEAKAASRGQLEASTLALQASTEFALVRAAISTAAGAGAALLLSWLLVGQVVRPLDRLTADAERHASGDVATTLSEGGNTAQVRRLRDAFQRLLDANQERQRGVEAARDELERRIAREEGLRATVEALSVPVVPLQADTLLLPLVGHLDERRSAQLTERLLAAVRERRARAVVIDITGLAGLSDDTARQLRQTAEAARLLGCRVTLVGVRSDQALILAAGDLAASGISTARDIPSVLAAG